MRMEIQAQREKEIKRNRMMSGAKYIAKTVPHEHPDVTIATAVDDRSLGINLFVH